MKIICVAGMPGSGKSIVVKAAKDLGLPVYNMGDVVREETIKRYGRITPEYMMETSIMLRKEHGPDVIARRIGDKIREAGSPIVVVDGIRSLHEVEYFKRMGDVVIIAIHSSPRTRFERILRRRRPGDPSTWEEFVKRDMIELEFGIGNVIALADYMIVNEGSIEEAYNRVKNILAGLMRQCT